MNEETTATFYNVITRGRLWSSLKFFDGHVYANEFPTGQWSK